MFIHTYETDNDFLTNTPCRYVAAWAGPKELRPEITKWCYQVFGPPGYNNLTYQTRWKDSIKWGEIFFSRKEDLEWFVLRWA